MNNSNNKSESGQAIVYLVLGIVVFFGFVALAIDGGMVLADRRNVQNAADAASLAGGGKAAANLQTGNTYKQNWNCGDVGYALHNAETAAINRAGANDFTITKGSDPDHNYVEATCNYAGRYIDVTVEISSTTPSNFLQLVYPNALHNEVEAVTRVFPGYPAGLGNAIVSLNDADCSDPGSDGGIVYSNQGSLIDIKGGGVFSNGCLRQNGNVTVTIDDGDALYHDAFNLDNNDWSPDPKVTDLTVYPSDFGIPFNVECTNTLKAKDLETALSKGEVKLSDGLNCITGDLSVASNDVLKGDSVTILMVDGKLTFNGGAEVDITAPPQDAAEGIPGVLIYIPPPDPFNPGACPIKKQELSLNGSENALFDGMILAPCSTVTLNGTGGNTYVGQVVGWNVYVGGDADLDLTYQRNPLFDKPASLELHR